MVKYVKIEGKRKCVVVSKTVSKDYAPHVGREGRRAAVYAHPVKRLIGKIGDLRRDMVSAGIEPLPFPRFRNRKNLSGYMSQLTAQALAEVGR